MSLKGQNFGRQKYGDRVPERCPGCGGQVYLPCRLCGQRSGQIREERVRDRRPYEPTAVSDAGGPGRQHLTVVPQLDGRHLRLLANPEFGTPDELDEAVAAIWAKAAELRLARPSGANPSNIDTEVDHVHPTPR